MKVSSTSFSTNSFNSMSASRKYGGLIKEKSTKKWRNFLFRLFDYVAVVTPQMRGLQAFISIWRIIQILGPSLCAGYSEFWGEGSNLQNTIDIISIFFHIIPGSALRKKVAPYFMIAIGCFFVLVLAFIFIAAYYYSKHAQLPNFIPTTIFFIFSTFGYILPPIGMNFIGEMVGYMIVDSSEVAFLPIFSIIFSLTAFSFYMLIFTMAYSVTISFRSDSLMTVIPTNQAWITWLVLLITLFPACGSKIPNKVTTIVFNILGAISYGCAIFVFLSKGGFVNQKYGEAAVATAVSGIIVVLFVAVYVLLEMMATEVIFIIFVVVWVVCYISVTFIVKRQMNRSLATLDMIADDAEAFYRIKSTLKFCTLVVDGFRHAHPFCLSYGIFKLAIEQWPKNYDIWLLFAKFSAIYPEETQQLAYIEVSMMQNKMKGSFAKHTMQQIESVIKQREANLIPELKTKIDRIGRKVQATKAKIRYIWDLVLQGNVKELEPIIGRAYESVQESNVSFIQLLGMFPNNRFVARAYARFLRDVVADHEQHSEWSQKVSNLQRGLMVTSDNCHDLGMLAFPLLPKSLDVPQAATQNPIANTTEDTLTQEIEGDDEKAAIDAEMKSSIKESIGQISIPSYKQTRILHLLLFFILFLIPFIAVSVYTPIFIVDTTGSLDYLYSLTRLRYKLFQGFGLMVHYAGENLNVSYSPDNPNNPNVVVFPFATFEDIKDQIGNETAGEAFGQTFDTQEQLRYVSQDLATIIQSIQSMISFMNGNKAMDKVRAKLFEPSFEYTHFSPPIYSDDWSINSNDESTIRYNTTVQNLSILDVATNYIAHMEELLKLDKVPEDVFNKRFYVTPLNNLRGLSDAISQTIQLMLSYINNVNSGIQSITVIAMIVLVIVVVIIYVSICIFIIIRMNSEKMAIYRCLTSLQKSVVSHVAESFRILRKEETEERSSRMKDEELSRQEENLLKLFSTSSDSGKNSTFDNLLTILLTIFLIIAHAAMVVYLITCFKDSGNQLDQTSPHIDHIYAAFTYDFASIILLYLLPGAVYPNVNYQAEGFNTDSILSVINEWQTQSQDEFSLVKYGDPDNNAPSFASLGIDIDSVIADATCDLNFCPANFHDVYDCMTPEATMALSQSLVNGLVNIYKFTNKHVIFAGNDKYLTHIWHMSMVHVFNQYFYPLFNEVANLVVDSMEARLPAMNTASFVVAGVVFIVIVLYLYMMYISENKQKYAMTLLLHCPGKVVLSNANAVSLLSGNFKQTTSDFTTRDSDFYDNLVEEMPDSMIILKVDGTVVTANKSTERIYGINKEEIIGNHITNFGERFTNTNPFKEVFEGVEKKTFERSDLSVKVGDDERFIEMQFVVMAEWLFTVSRDITQKVMYDKLIQEEKTKSDKLLSSILPPRLVPRVAAGEKDISFAVQSVTIVFMDIVSFTPWCGSLPAATVMKTLNMLFKEFDALTQIHSTMTKIKCIGDCYMAAGGIFMEVNQPAVHAKDVVEFGLDAIQAVLDLDEKINESLRIRVGINTGGPIVAGVLGTEKPTFEILGPTINMAQQMEHHGVPMKVHISRAVYELIYGGNFKIQERGEVEIKNGTTVTYLVEKDK
ncbi:Adenylate and Guanylate cyclase catalytic domain containing protein [Tritrichomonas foetus]|uniref:Adenylate and Guanylate cyclase catalytic domain containing protein n=1 Tax=Tritrichomonas foetus TaxID=1144522 RepID=A0A1J4KRE2_9EUKA|nr:Adenylate and Guanylate cyclase catalytic domain containing protein [Tritrichomonas foetus]|eukprot:OHT13831.1 Adenylate and Guanylate cyclase catalytic domain containing protein [Tritrichomonas foetus]